MQNEEHNTDLPLVVKLSGSHVLGEDKLHHLLEFLPLTRVPASALDRAREDAVVPLRGQSSDLRSGDGLVVRTRQDQALSSSEALNSPAQGPDQHHRRSAGHNQAHSAEMWASGCRSDYSSSVQWS